MSESKETGSGDEAQADSQREGAEASEEATHDEAGEAEQAEAAEAGEGSAPKKKKKKAREASEPENIRDRNARVRAEAADKRRFQGKPGEAPARRLEPKPARTLGSAPQAEARRDTRPHPSVRSHR